MEYRAVQSGKYKEFLFLFFPVLLIAFSSSLYLMVEKLLLGFFSTEAMEAAVTVASVTQIFQLGTVAIAMMAQVFIGEQYGEQNWKAMGPSVWQYIWFAFLSIFVVFPLGSLYGTYYLKGMPFEAIAKPYLYFLLSVNFLYPLGASLSSFYIAQGSTLLVFFATLGSQALKIFLAYWLIPLFAQKSPLWGLYGAAISTLVAQVLFFAILFFKFLHPTFAQKYNSRDFRFQPSLFWKRIQPGLLRACNKVLSGFCGASIAHLLVSKTELYRLSFSIGVVLFLFLPFLSEALYQSQTVIVSRLIGAKKFSSLFKAFGPGYLVCLVCIIFVGIPLLFFPLATFQFLFPKIILDPALIRPIFLGIWLSFAFFTMLYVPLGYVLAFKDMYFSAFMGLFGWVNGYLLIYYLVEKIGIGPEYSWLALSLMHGSTALIYFLRARTLCNRAAARSDGAVVQVRSN